MVLDTALLISKIYIHSGLYPLPTAVKEKQWCMHLYGTKTLRREVRKGNKTPKWMKESERMQDQGSGGLGGCGRRVEWKRGGKRGFNVRRWWSRNRVSKGNVLGKSGNT